MEKMMQSHWWKVLGVLLVLYGLIAGMLVPLKPNLVSVAPDSAKLGETFTLEVVGYNTSFLGAAAGAEVSSSKGKVNAWLIGGDSTDLSLRATNVEVVSDRLARFTFTLPEYLPDPTTEKAELPLYVNTSADGAFVEPRALTVRQDSSGTPTTVTEAGWRVTHLRKGDLSATPRTTFPYRGHLAETIRNLYFHVSLWFAMMFVFIAAVVFAIIYLVRSRRASTERFDVVSSRDRADYWSVAFTSVGMLFGLLGLVTGAVWARYTWNSFWSWDIKQVTTLIALMIYAGRARLSATYNIFAFVCLIPLIYILPRLSGNSLHPGAAGNPGFGGEDLDNTMRMVFYPIIIGWTLFGFWMAGVTYRARLLKERLLLRD